MALRRTKRQQEANQCNEEIDNANVFMLFYVKRMMYELEDEIEDEVEVVAISRQWILFI